MSKQQASILEMRSKKSESFVALKVKLDSGHICNAGCRMQGEEFSGCPSLVSGTVSQFHSFSGCPSEGGWHISQFSGCPSEPIGGWHSFWLGCTSGSPRWRGCRRAEDGSGRQASLQSPAAKGSASSCWPAKACCQLEGASYSTSQPQPPHCLSAQDVQESSTERAGEDFVCDSHALEE